MHLSMSSRRGEAGIGRGFARSLWPGGRAFELSCCPVSRDIWIFVRAHDHKSFPGVENFSRFDLTFLPGGRESASNFWENVKIPPYAPPSLPAGLTLIGALERVEISGKPHLAVACGTVTGTKQNTGSCIVPSNDPTSDCEMRYPRFLRVSKVASCVAKFSVSRAAQYC